MVKPLSNLVTVPGNVGVFSCNKPFKLKFKFGYRNVSWNASSNQLIQFKSNVTSPRRSVNWTQIGVGYSTHIATLLISNEIGLQQRAKCTNF